ncbi:caspase domain-containing protein [Streptomyces fuscichromogenes]|uniref:caspase family protein n=1 Tax=Streptomyces fuscichromogenes TaxID=1324013 RepID=UPI0037F513B8
MRGRHRALLIGNAHFPNDPALTDLKGPPNDVLRLAAALCDAEVGVFDVEDVEVLLERDSAQILDALRILCGQAGQNDVQLIYYSGHGLPGPPGTGTLVLCGRDTSSASPSTAVGFPELDAILRTSPAAATVIILDCCLSGAAKAAPDTRPLAGRGRFVLTACGPREAAGDAPTVTAMSRFTGHVVTGLLGGAGRPYAETITFTDLYEYLFATMSAEGEALPTVRQAATGSAVLARAPVEPPPAGQDVGVPRPKVLSQAPRWLRTTGRWGLAVFLLLLVGFGALGFQALGDELAYRAQWTVAEGVSELQAVGSLGPAFTEIAFFMVGAGAGLFLAASLLARVLGAFWWIPPLLLVLAASRAMFDGLDFYGDNTALLLVPAAIITAVALRQPAGERRAWRRTVSVVAAVAVVLYPCAYLAYDFGQYVGSGWTVGDAMTFTSLKESAAIGRVTWVWAAAVTGFAVGAAAAHWILPHVPVLGRSPRGAARGRARPWPHDLARWTAVVVCVPLAMTLAVRNYVGRPDFAFTDPAMRAMALGWFGFSSGCEETTCTLRAWETAAVDVEFLALAGPKDALAWVRSDRDRDRVIAYEGTDKGYTYWIEKYDGHSGRIVWTHERCGCVAYIDVRDDKAAYEQAVSTFWYATDISKPEESG